MQVSNQNSRVNFTSTPIHYVNLKKVTNGERKGCIRAIVSKLDPEDTFDKRAIEDINKKWNLSSNLLYWLCDDFSKNKNEVAQYFAIEKIGSGTLAEKIVGLLQVYPQKSFITKRDNLILSTIVTKPEFAKSNASRKMQNIGEALLGETFSIAKEKNIADVKIYASESNYKFYSESFKRAGLSDAEFKNPSAENLYEFVINERSFEKYINYCQKKYKTNFSASI